MLLVLNGCVGSNDGCLHQGGDPRHVRVLEVHDPLDTQLSGAQPQANQVSLFDTGEPPGGTDQPGHAAHWAGATADLNPAPAGEGEVVLPEPTPKVEVAIGGEDAQRELLVGHEVGQHGALGQRGHGVPPLVALEDVASVAQLLGELLLVQAQVGCQLGGGRRGALGQGREQGRDERRVVEGGGHATSKANPPWWRFRGGAPRSLRRRSPRQRPGLCIEETHRGAMPRSAAKQRPGLPADVIGGHQPGIPVSRQQCPSLVMSTVRAVSDRDPERGVDEDHS